MRVAIRGIPALLVAAVALGAAAEPAPPAPPKWADWVGAWHGKLRWTGCIIVEPGEAMGGGDHAGSAGGAGGKAPRGIDAVHEGKIRIEAADGAVSIDLAGAGQALGVMSLVEERGGWLGQHADVTVHLRRPRADVVQLAIELASGCALRATLHRRSVGIPACDRLAGWAAIEARCTKLARPPLENLARLVRQRLAWTKARGGARDHLAAQCAARAGRVEAELVDAGCAPNPDPRIGMRGAECQALREGAAWFGRCASLPPDLKAAIAREVMGLVSAAQTADDAELPVVDAQCRELRARIVAAGRRASCPP